MEKNFSKKKKDEKKIQERKEKLKKLISQITPQNKHKEIEWGTPVGKEVW